MHQSYLFILFLCLADGFSVTFNLSFYGLDSLPLEAAGKTNHKRPILFYSFIGGGGGGGGGGVKRFFGKKFFFFFFFFVFFFFGGGGGKKKKKKKNFFFFFFWGGGGGGGGRSGSQTEFLGQKFGFLLPYY